MVLAAPAALVSTISAVSASISTRDAEISPDNALYYAFVASCTEESMTDGSASSKTAASAAASKLLDDARDVSCTPRDS